jgi:hypothetical protein
MSHLISSDCLSVLSGGPKTVNSAKPPSQRENAKTTKKSTEATAEAKKSAEPAAQTPKLPLVELTLVA